MHIPDGFIDPRLAGGMGLGAVFALGYAIHKVKQAVLEPAAQTVRVGVGKAGSIVSDKAKKVLGRFGQEYILKIGMVASLVFAAQMFNFPISSGTSGHLIGGVLAAVLLGPWGGLLAVSSVVIIQALFYADGGLIVMGSNIINMALIGSLCGYYIYAWLKKKLSSMVAIAVAAWSSVVLAALACSLELGISGTFSFSKTLSAMVPVHMIIGIGEAIITIGLIKISKVVMGWKES